MTKEEFAAFEARHTAAAKESAENYEKRIKDLETENATLKAKFRSIRLGAVNLLDCFTEAPELRHGPTAYSDSFSPNRYRNYQEIAYDVFMRSKVERLQAIQKLVGEVLE
jgi:hypothetical protein